MSYEVPIVGQADDATAPSATPDGGAAVEPAEIESAGAEQAEPENAGKGEELEGGEDSVPNGDAPKAAADGQGDPEENADVEDAEAVGASGKTLISAQPKAAKATGAVLDFAGAVAQSEELSTSLRAAVPDIPSMKTTTINANGGTISYFFINGNPQNADGTINWGSENAIKDSHKTPGGVLDDFKHRGGGNVGGGGSGTHGYFHTRKKSDTYQQAGIKGEGTYLDGSEKVQLYYVNLHVTRAYYSFVKWTIGKNGAVYEREPSGKLDGRRSMRIGALFPIRSRSMRMEAHSRMAFRASRHLLTWRLTERLYLSGTLAPLRPGPDMPSRDSATMARREARGGLAT